MQEQNKSLALIVAQSSTIVQSIIENGGELSPELEAELEESAKDVQTKAEAYAVIWERMEAEAELWKRKAEEMSRIAKSCLSVREKLKERLAWAMQELDVKEITADSYRFKLAKTSGSLEILDEDAVPADFKSEKVSTVIDKKALKEHLAALRDLGETVEPGARLVFKPSIRKYANTKK